jgi:ATP-dependent Clp protease ATP-binding subunit ClpC
VEQGIIERVGPVSGPAPTEAPFTPRAARVVAASVEEALMLGHNYIGTEHLLIALYREPEGIGAQLLDEAGISRDAVIQEVVQILAAGNFPPTTST